MNGRVTMQRAAPVAAVLLLAAVPRPARADTIALTGATVHPVSGPVLEGATVLIRDGKIAAVGPDVAVPPEATRIDLTGEHLYPGMIAAHTSLGLIEIPTVTGTVDLNETGHVNPNARAKYAINADSELIPVARAGGVLTVESATQGPGISGTGTVWKLDGWNWEDMTVLDPAALHVRWPNMVPAHRFFGPPQPEEEQKKEREKQLGEIRDAFDNARVYMKAKEAEAHGGPHHDSDVRWEAMIPALRRDIPVFIDADEMTQIETALDFAREESLRVVIVGGRDAWRVADRLAAENVPVVLENVLDLPRRSWEPYDVCYGEAAKLQAAGVRFCISTGNGEESVANLRNLPYNAAMAAAYGLPKDEALKSVTLYPAQILGVADRLGSIEPGKDATLIATDGDPLEIESHVLEAWIEGKPVDLTSRHTRLYEKYRNRPRRDGKESKLEPAIPERGAHR
jgi:imidazolonepropionase-like amidohydrolase